MSKKITLDEYLYELPDSRIAKYPIEHRDQSKLLQYRDGIISDHRFFNLEQLIAKNSLLVFNNTRVIQARLPFKKSTGAQIEIFCLEPISPSEYNLSLGSTSKCVWKCFVGNAKKWKNGFIWSRGKVNEIDIELRAEIKQKLEDAYEIQFEWNAGDVTFSEVLEHLGVIPIPPYLNRESESEDQTNYQTIYSKINGSVAAPTAGLHFTSDLLDRLEENSISTTEITLHVGAGTFKPVKTNSMNDHEMHTEHFWVTKIALQKLIDNIGNITVVGTTTVRTLESLYLLGCKTKINSGIDPKDLVINQWDWQLAEFQKITPLESLTSLKEYLIKNNLDYLASSTQIMIIPGYHFKLTNRMITNFHQPGSTLLLLVSAFIGDAWRMIYNHALKSDYRFLSYGDGSLLFPETTATF